MGSKAGCAVPSLCATSGLQLKQLLGQSSQLSDGCVSALQVIWYSLEAAFGDQALLQASCCTSTIGYAPALAQTSAAWHEASAAQCTRVIHLVSPIMYATWTPQHLWCIRWELCQSERRRSLCCRVNSIFSNTIYRAELKWTWGSPMAPSTPSIP